MKLKRNKMSLLALVGAFAATPLFAAETADTAYTNGKIYTVNEKSPWAEAVAIKDRRFVKVGSNSEVAEFVGKNTAVIDLGGKFAMPGVHDVHIHPAYQPFWRRHKRFQTRQGHLLELVGGRASAAASRTASESST
jgi:cytosine/adenosine deaminase-related metal-dependent hydrolase